MLDISQVILMRTDSNLCRKQLTVHWSVPNSLIRSYFQPCTNSMWGMKVKLWLPLSDCTGLWCPKGGSFLSRSSHNSPELCQMHFLTYMDGDWIVNVYFTGISANKRSLNCVKRFVWKLFSIYFQNKLSLEIFSMGILLLQDFKTMYTPVVCSRE